MKSRTLLTTSVLLAVSACSHEAAVTEAVTTSPVTGTAGARAVAAAGVPLRLVLAPLPSGQAGDGGAGSCADVDRRIAAEQEKVRQHPDQVALLERLGALFVVKARLAYDPGFYELAEACADCMERAKPGTAAALLLRGHVAHSLHRFAEAEAIARQLVAARGGVLDHGLLGDVLLDRGELREALAASQKMLDLKPCLQSYARAARVRWLRGDLDGARELLLLAKGAGSSRDPDSLAWTYAQLADVELQRGDLEAAKQACAAALAAVPDAAAALLVQARVALAEGRPQDALPALRRAAALNPLPEYQWALADALRRVGAAGEAAAVEAALLRKGAQEDPRTFALFLATRGRNVEQALVLTERELAARTDVHTWDARAWALLQGGESEPAWAAAQKALAEGTQDARLFLHAGAIAQASGRAADARRWLDRAHDLRRALLPSEQDHLAARRAAL